jgi:predicted regulator of Ras-like GTPase activity (Roadblock/LC7/MglB family)
MQAKVIETVGMLSALIYGAAQSIAAPIDASVSYIHQHGDIKDLLLLRINETFGLIIAFDEELGLGAICMQCAALRRGIAADFRVLV